MYLPLYSIFSNTRKGRLLPFILFSAAPLFTTSVLYAPPQTLSTLMGTATDLLAQHAATIIPTLLSLARNDPQMVWGPCDVEYVMIRDHHKIHACAPYDRRWRA